MLFYLLTSCLVLVRNVASDCGVVSKSEWNGLEPTRVQYLPRPVSLVIIQHTVTPNCTTDAGCKEIVANIQDNHMQWFSDIGHSFLVGGNGKVYEGTGWLHVGAHTVGYNSRSIGISFIGNFNEYKPTSQAVEAVKKLIKCGVENGHLSPDYHVVAHLQLIATESPGRHLYREIRTWPDWLEDVSAYKNKS